MLYDVIDVINSINVINAIDVIDKIINYLYFSKYHSAIIQSNSNKFIKYFFTNFPSKNPKIQ